MQGWEDHKSLASVVWEQTDMCLNVYAEDSSRVLQDANNERRISGGGYASRQLEELTQNAVDAARYGGSRVEVVLTKETLYVANDGRPFTAEGVRSLMASDISTKDDEQIGKFGIGFKSILAISSTPRVLSRTVAFAFDAEWSRATLVDSGYDSPAYPVMRLARTVDPLVEASKDPVLAGLMSWASTVIVAPLREGYFELSKRLYSFPSEFVLFSAHITTVALRNLAEPDPLARASRSGRPAEREITRTVDEDGTVTLRSGREATRWSIATREVSPTTSALDDGGHAASRKRLDISYALKLPPGNELGTFWAYFPTHDRTTLSGIVNAPWKLSEDRIRLLPGRFNEELLDHVPSLFSDAVTALSAEGQGVMALDATPARGREERSWADDYINEPVFAHLRTVASLPDGHGRLRRPNDLKWVGEMDPELLMSWAETPNAPVAEWVHPDAYRTPERRNRVERLMGRRSRAEVKDWLEALTAGGDAHASANAIRLAAKVIAHARRTADAELRTRLENGVRDARIVRLENGELRAPTRGRVFVRAEGDERDDVEFVDPALTEIAGVAADLSELGVVVMDRTGEMHAALARLSEAGPAEADRLWAQIWALMRDLPRETAVNILREDLPEPLTRVVGVKTAAGTWTTPEMSFLSGSIIPPDAARDREFLIDPAFHRDDVDLLHEIGAVDAPVRRYGSPREPWLSSYEDSIADAFIRKQKAAKPDRDKLVFDGAQPPWPLQPLIEMSPAARIAVTNHLLAQGLDSPWLVRHTTNRQYGSTRFTGPEAWFVRRYGLLQTAFGAMPPRRVLRAGEAIDPEILPAFEATDAQAAALDLRSDPDDLESSEWENLKRIADGWVASDEDDGRRVAFYAWLPGRIEPESLVARVGRGRQSVPTKNIGVATDRGTYDSMLEAQIPAILVLDAEDAERFIDHWEMPRGTDLLQEEIVVSPAGEAEYITDVFPPLKLWLDPVDHDLLLQPAERLEKMVATKDGQVGRRISFYREGPTVFVTAREPRDSLSQIAQALNLGMSTADIASVIEQMEETAVDGLRAELRAALDDDVRLVAAVGVDALRRIVPAQAVAALEQREGDPSEASIARLARAVHGVSILKQLRPALEELGLQPPREWTGRGRTRNWVASLGFPIEWAGFPESRRPAMEQVDGPAVLKPLHEYQVQVTERIAALLKGVGKDRGLVSLPTGAGKTRVTVEALINGVREGDIDLGRPLVWIAQSDELCEQAAETWTYVWRAVGGGVPMSLGRLWGDNELTEEPDSFQLVIAGVSKLHKVVSRPGDDYEWLRDPSVVVVDEAHTSITGEYTTVLEWLGRGSRGRSEDKRRPLIGLTATPFRGTSEEETKRLAQRYDGHRLDRGSFRNDDDPYGELQEMGVLARVRQIVLDGSEVHLSPEDVTEIETMRRLPGSVSERIGADLTRTRRIIESIHELDENSTALVFCPSVENARVLAGLLSNEGVPSVAISSDSEPAARRHYIEEFKARRIRVITNYGVLTQGFDAPSIEAVYLARPTFSPNVYQQMIGRGLRGPKNGGSEEVLVVNVKDNFDRFGELLAFNAFEHLWTRT